MGRGDVARAAALALTAACCFVSLARAALVLDPDMGVLEAVLSSWTSFSGRETWIRGMDCSSMAGVDCDLAGHVVAIDLVNNSVSASLPEAITALDQLSWLGIHASGLTGSLPSALFSMRSLRHLVLTSNSLTGAIPDTLGVATGLQSLILSFNQLTGTLPSSLGTLSSLKNLELRSNALWGSIPESLSNLRNLERVYLDHNGLSGPIPDFRNSPGMKALLLEYNGLTGTLPASLGALTNLETLSAFCNRLSGSIPATLGNCGALTLLDVSENGFSGSIPATLGNLASLKHLFMVATGLTGSLPNELSRLQQLSYFALGYNLFDGSIPSGLGNLRKLNYLMLRRNGLYGTIPGSLGNLNRLTGLDLSINYLGGTIPDAFSTLTNLDYLIVERNQLVGRLPSLRLMPQLQLVNARDNFLTSTADPLEQCTPQLLLENNCFAHNLTICGMVETQRGTALCKWFCSNSPSMPACSRHGRCISNDAVHALCVCDYGFSNGHAPGTCVPEGPYPPVSLSSYSDSMTLYQSASSAPNGTLFLSSAPSSASWGAAFTPTPIALFLPSTAKKPCDRPAAFSVHFAFRMTPTAAAAAAGSSAGGEGLAFVVSAALPHRGVGLGLGGVGRRSVAVEFDSVLSVRHSDPNDNHVGVNVGASPVSLASATAPLILNDAQTKHAWILYDPTAGGTLTVFLSGSERQPAQPLLRARVSLCSALQPTKSSASFFFGFVAASASKTQRHDILWWNIVTGGSATNWNARDPGVVFGWVVSPEEAAAGMEGESVPSSFHYASLAFLPTALNSPSWSLPMYVSWMQDESTWPVKNQHGCADSSVFAVVGAVEAAYSIMSNWSQPPLLSVDHLRLALSSNCHDMSPRQVLAFLAAASRNGGGLLDQAAAAGASQPRMASLGRRERLVKPKYYGIAGFEETSFGGWLGLLLAVQRQPVVVRIEASALSFRVYRGTYKYADSNCYEKGVNHAVLLVGYAVPDAAAAGSPWGMAAPLWVVRNSWGSEWGNAGHMFMDMQSGPGICGINTLPGLFPTVRSTADPCGSKSVQVAAGEGVAASSAFNPCGQFNCSKAGASNRCTCAAPHFVEASHPDGSKTCAYVDACGLAGINPCVVGTCINDGRGKYSCVCPTGFSQGTTAKGSLSCAPGDSRGSYTVRGSNVWCSDLLPVLSLSLDQLKQQNKRLSCSKAIPVGTKLSVKPPQPLPSCSLFYTTHPGDTCMSIAALFNLTQGCSREGEACGEAVVGLNSQLDCAELRARQTVCVEQDESRVGEVAVCEQYYELEGSTDCDAAMMAVDPPLSPLEFFRLNPGVNCNNRLPTASVEGYSQRQVCIGSSVRYKVGTCPGATYTVAAGDSCSMIDVKGFASIKGCYRKLNGFECLEKVAVGAAVCTPDASNARVGICSMRQ